VIAVIIACVLQKRLQAAKVMVYSGNKRRGKALLFWLAPMKRQ